MKLIATEQVRAEFFRMNNKFIESLQTFKKNMPQNCMSSYITKAQRLKWQNNQNNNGRDQKDHGPLPRPALTPAGTPPWLGVWPACKPLTAPRPSQPCPPQQGPPSQSGVWLACKPPCPDRPRPLTGMLTLIWGVAGLQTPGVPSPRPAPPPSGNSHLDQVRPAGRPHPCTRPI